jgi:hypothetical protein
MSKITKSFGTILKDNNYVKKFQSTKYKSVQKKITKELPSEFNPIDKWGIFLSPVQDQGKCGACWAIASTKTLNDRYSILTIGAFTDALSPYQMVMCQGTIFPNIPLDKDSVYEINLNAHTEGACNGNSLFTAMDFLYAVGCVSESCVSRGLFKDYNIPDISEIVKSENVPMCQSILGDNYDRCMDRGLAPRFYRSIAGYQVDSDVESIKQEIYKWGPVTTGFNVYDDFINEYDGKTIYMGPKKDSQKQGGHSVEILGWGKENGVDFWWICNSWGTSWGLSGFFKMKMNIEECELEKNVVAFIPDFPKFKLDMINYSISTSPDLIILRKWMDINPTYGYKNSSIQEIKQGKVKGDLIPIFVTTIPDMTTEWLGEIDKHLSVTYYSVPRYQKGMMETVKDNYISLFFMIAFIIICYYIGKSIAKR